MEKLDGAWEPRGYIGPRVEIEGNRLVRLWRGGPVLDTKFSVREEGDRTVLVLKNKDLCYVNASRPYASIKECYLQGEKLVLVDDFPITGESTDELVRTTNSRYGNVEIVDDEILPQLKGMWYCEGFNTRMKIKGNKIQFYMGDLKEEEVKIVTVRYRSQTGYPGAMIRNEDPSIDGVGHFGQMTFENGVIRTYIPVCDAPSIDLIFVKE